MKNIVDFSLFLKERVIGAQNIFKFLPSFLPSACPSQSANSWVNPIKIHFFYIINYLKTYLKTLTKRYFLCWIWIWWYFFYQYQLSDSSIFLRKKLVFRFFWKNWPNLIFFTLNLNMMIVFFVIANCFSEVYFFGNNDFQKMCFSKMSLYVIFYAEFKYVDNPFAAINLFSQQHFFMEKNFSDFFFINCNDLFQVKCWSQENMYIFYLASFLSWSNWHCFYFMDFIAFSVSEGSRQVKYLKSVRSPKRINEQYS